MTPSDFYTSRDKERIGSKKEKLMFYVYILKCKDGSYYTGHTDDLERRIAEHKIGLYDGYT